MSKEAEQSYLEKLGDAGWRHSLEKPFSDEHRGVNLASIGAILSLLPPPPGWLLDFGCGGGWTSIFFAKCGYEVIGQDISQAMIELACTNKEINLKNGNLSFLKSDYENLEFSEEFDCAIFFDSLHHSDDELAALKSAYRALKPGGVLITHEPGAGHSINHGSIEAMKLYGVNERDMPPHLIIEQGGKVGFDGFRVFPMPDEIHKTFYGKPPPRILSGSGYKLAKRLFKLAFKPSMRASSIVVLRKPA